MFNYFLIRTAKSEDAISVFGDQIPEVARFFNSRRHFFGRLLVGRGPLPNPAAICSFATSD